LFSSKKRLAVLGLSAFALIAVACANKVDLGEETDTSDASAPPPSLVPVPPDDGGDAADTAPPRGKPVLACVGTECPYPYSTCSNVPSVKCGTNLMNDPNNCGACGVSCGGYDPINMAASCVQGQCAFECQIKQPGGGVVMDFRNCNGLLDDGCEIEVQADPKNCGVCGHACQAGERCIKGKCGCSGGLTDCNGRCVDPRSDNSNCGACGTSCNVTHQRHRDDDRG
jgi:hypothetical protein